jgi:ElaA protein
MPADNIKWIFSSFDLLKNHDLYQLLKLRQDVFIIEQNCIYPDIDNLDQYSYHLLGYKGDMLAAYLRIVPPGKKYDFPSIGRVIVSEHERNKGLGQKLVDQGVLKTKQLYENNDIYVEAQAHLNDFYQRSGFQRITESYDVDGIPHIRMVLTHSSA